MNTLKVSHEYAPQKLHVFLQIFTILPFAAEHPPYITAIWHAVGSRSSQGPEIDAMGLVSA